MAIRIVRNEQGNCINFYGSSNPTYWNACLSGEVDSTDSNAVNVINDIITAETGTTQYEFFRIPYTEFVDAQGNGFADAQAAADYITAQANVVGLGGGGTDLIGIDVCFKLDDTSTSVMLDNGYAYGVNTIKAVEESGNISIKSFLGDITYFVNLEVGRVCNGIDDSIIPGGLNDVINWLNELFTVGAFQEVVISDPFSTLVADVNGVPSGYTLEGSTVVDPVGDAIATNSSSGNYAGLLSEATIDQPGEYFTFDIQGEGQIGFGLVHTQQSFDDGYFSGSSTYADPTSFAVGNSAHYGFQFSHWFHPTPNGSWTNYGANTSYSMQPGWYSANTEFEARDEWLAGDPIKIRVGLDENGYIAIYSLKDDGTTWVKHARTSYPATDGSEFRLGVKFANASSKVYSAPKVHRLDSASAPTTLGDQTISTFGDGLTGTISGGGVSAISIDGLANDGFISNQVINAVGEFYEFTWSGGPAWFGLFSENEYDLSDLTTSADADEDWTANGNAKLNDFVYYGSKAFGSNGDISNKIGDLPYSGALNAGTGNYFARVGFDSQGRASVWVSNDGGSSFTLYHHATTTAAAGDYKFIWIPANNGAVIESLEQGTISSAPVMNFRYIESPDGYYSYPLFATQEEANYYNLISGGAGTSHTHVYADDPTNTTWYMPEAYNQMNYGLTPVEDGVTTFNGNTITWTEITSLTNADLVPAAFADTTYTVDELSQLNIQTQPVDVDYSTTFSGLEGVLDTIVAGVAGALTGTAPEVTGDNVANPSDTYTIGVIRSNNYGSSQGEITLVVNNLTAPTVTPITGFTHEAASTALVDSDTMDDGSVVKITEVIGDGERLVIDREWITRNVIPAISPQSGTRRVKIGFGNDSGNPSLDWSTYQTENFWIAYEYLCDDNSRAGDNFRLRPYVENSLMANVGVGGLSSSTAGLYDVVFINDNGDVKIGALVESQNIDASTKVFDTNDSAWNWEYVQSTGTIGDKSIYIQIDNCQMDIDTNNLNEYSEPVPTTSLTNWNKALNFSGGSEHLAQVTTDSNRNALKMNGASSIVAAPTAGQTVTSGHPWATAIVFQTPNNTTNQHIWNLGEGAGTNDDNIYLRMTGSNGELYFGWGRTGVGYNEYHIGNFGGSYNQSTGQWWGIYIGFNGTRLSATDATAANLVNAFDIRLMGTNDVTPVFSNLYNVGNDVNNWTSTGVRMDRQFTGDFTIGGRGANRSFHGKVAAMVVTALRCGVAMPTDAEIKLMLTDPQKWLTDYKVGNAFRLPWQTSDAGFNFSMNDGSSSYSTQVWLMGDGTNDSYSNGIRNQVLPTDQNYTKLQLNSMVSNDFETVNISGLS